MQIIRGTMNRTIYELTWILRQCFNTIGDDVQVDPHFLTLSRDELIRIVFLFEPRLLLLLVQFQLNLEIQTVVELLCNPLVSKLNGFRLNIVEGWLKDSTMLFLNIGIKYLIWILYRGYANVMNRVVVQLFKGSRFIHCRHQVALSSTVLHASILPSLSITGLADVTHSSV